MKRLVLATALFIITPAFAQQADPVADLKGQWQATMVVGVGNIARSLDMLVAAYQSAQIAAAVATARAAYWEDACKSVPACGGADGR